MQRIGNMTRGIARAIFGSRNSSTHLDDMVDVLSGQQEAIHYQITSLENFVLSAPRLAMKRQLDSVDVVPPPEDYHEPEALPLSRAQERAIGRNRFRHLMVFSALLSCLFGFGCWLYLQLATYGLLPA